MTFLEFLDVAFRPEGFLVGFPLAHFWMRMRQENAQLDKEVEDMNDRLRALGANIPVTPPQKTFAVYVAKFPYDVRLIGVYRFWATAKVAAWWRTRRDPNAATYVGVAKGSPPPFITTFPKARVVS